MLPCIAGKLKKVFYNSQTSVGDRQYTIILFISIIFLPTILNFLNDKERGRYYHFVGFWRSPMPPPPPHNSKILYYLNDRDEGRYYFCRVLAPPPPPMTPQYLTTCILMTERGGAIISCRIFAPPPPPPPFPDATLLNYPNDRERGAPLSFVGLWRPLTLSQTPQHLTILMTGRGGGRQYPIRS